MKPALCDLALPITAGRLLLPAARELGFLGIEAAPHRIAPGGTVEDGGPTAAQATAFRREVEAAGMTVVGLHALLAGRPDLGLFDPWAARRTCDHLVHLSALCRDLGGRTLVLGGAGRGRGQLSLRAAWLACRDFLEDLLPRIEDHGTVLCFAPLGPNGGDFATTAADCRILADALDHPSLSLQLNSAAQVENGDTGHVPFNAARGRLEQFGVSAADGAPAETLGAERHADFRRHLATVRFGGWLALKQRPTADPLDGLHRGWRLLAGTYLRGDRNVFVPPHRPHACGQRAAATT